MRNRSYDSRRLSYLVAKDKLSYQELSRNIGMILQQEVMATTVRRHVLGVSQPNLQYLAAYSDYFCLPVDYFFEGLLE
jgi:hypothetical protein